MMCYASCALLFSISIPVSLRFGPFRTAFRPISRYKTAHFAVRNGPFCNILCASKLCVVNLDVCMQGGVACLSPHILQRDCCAVCCRCRGVVLMLTAADLGILHHGLKILIILIFITAIICAFNKFSVTLQL